MNTDKYDKIAYKKYKAFCYMEREELLERGCEVDFQMISFEDFVKKINEDPKFASVWGYWNFL